MSELRSRTAEKINKLKEKLGFKVGKNVGNLAVASSVEGAAAALSRRASLIQRSWDQTHIVGDLYRNYLTDAAARGMTKEEVRDSLVSAWNKGVLPRVIQGETLRDFGHGMLALKGELPADLPDRLAIDVRMPQTFEDGYHLEGGVMVGRSYYSDQLPSARGLHGYKVEAIGFGVGSTNRQLERGVRRVDAIIAPYAQSSEAALPPQQPPAGQ